MKGKINELPNIDTSKYNVDESGNVLREKRMTDEEKYKEFTNIVCEMLGFNKPVDILRLCKVTSDFIRPYEIKIKELEKENERLKAQIAGAKVLQKENEQLKEGNKQLAKRICELQSDLGKARETIKAMKTCPMLICHNCQQDCIANTDYSKDWIKNWEVKE